MDMFINHADGKNFIVHNVCAYKIEGEFLHIFTSVEKAENASQRRYNPNPTMKDYGDVYIKTSNIVMCCTMAGYDNIKY